MKPTVERQQGASFDSHRDELNCMQKPTEVSGNTSSSPPGWPRHPRAMRRALRALENAKKRSRTRRMTFRNRAKALGLTAHAIRHRSHPVTHREEESARVARFLLPHLRERRIMPRPPDGVVKFSLMDMAELMLGQIMRSSVVYAQEIKG